MVNKAGILSSDNSDGSPAQRKSTAMFFEFETILLELKSYLKLNEDRQSNVAKYDRA